jgi:hypothetical protein
MNISMDPWVWLASIGMVAMLSFVFKENIVYSFFEHVFVGASAGYAVSINFQNIITRAWNPLTNDGKMSLIIPIVLGIMLYARFFRKFSWLSRWSVSFLVGVGSGLAIYGVVRSQFIAQIQANMLPLNSINNLILVFGVMSILVYFFFSIEHRGPIMHVSMFGRMIMMITFGVSFGNVVMGRISLLLGVLESLLGRWLGLL